MTLIKRVSKRKNNRGQNFVDYYLLWEYQNSLYAVRVEPCFNKDIKKFFATAVEVSDNEPFAKYVA